MMWVWAPMLACVLGLGLVMARTRRRQGLLTRIDELLTAGHHQQVLDHDLQPGPLLDPARLAQATSAVRSGRFRLALDLLATSADDGTYLPPAGTAPTASTLRASALIGMGRYGEVARMLGHHPPQGPLSRLRAQAAVEAGEDTVAEDLLAAAAADPMEEAARLRLLADLRLRRRDLTEGERLARTARATFAGSSAQAAQLDAALCTLLIARMRVETGAVAEALPLVNAGLEGLQSRPDEPVALAEAHALAATVQAALGNGLEAGKHLALAQEQASRCQSPPLDAVLARAAALVALQLGDRETGRRLLHEAIADHEQLGAKPALAELRSVLAGLDA
ncbi:hypothetical protein ABEG17_19065 [Pedococcus sp. KACC 23699]|uniref:Tetratricopeptide repeat protein n=1 Tax=Pedococcus sp. KACC 23699 TaxID=3149228 RepID=A0AAU7JTA5_9MICO